MECSDWNVVFSSVLEMVNRALVHERNEKMVSTPSQLTDDKYLMEYSYWKETASKVKNFRNDATVQDMENTVKEKLKVN